MLSRLFKPNAPLLRPALGFSWLGLLAVVAACGGNRFDAAPSSGGNGSGADENGGGVDTNSSGDGGSVEPGGGTGGELPSAGSGGKPATSCTCSAGNYCRDGTTMCLSCAEFSRIQFTTPQKLESLSQLGSQRFPRPGTTRSGLFYTVGAPAATKIWYAPAPVSGVGALVTVGIKVESGPLLAPDVIGAKNLYFERTEALSKNRKLYVAKWSGTAETNDVLAPTPYNAVGFDDYSIAVSSEAKLVYWMSTRNGAPQLLSFASADAAATVSVLDLKVSANCTRAGDDATPWVNSAGTVLLFRSTSLDDDCAPSDSGANDLFAVPLASNGTPLSVAVPLATLNTIGGGSDQTDPAFSADSCVIYYASDSGSGNYDLYRAARK